MTETQQFIEDAIAGGYEIDLEEDVVATVLLDPLAWQAVGKQRDWTENVHSVPPASNHLGILYHGGMHMLEGIQVMCEASKWKMTNFMAHLADGKTIDEALAAIK